MGRSFEGLLAESTGDIQFSGGGTNYIVQTPDGVLYCIYADAGSDLKFKKSSDGGLTWSVPVTIFTGTITAISVWYDRWSGINAGLIHIAYTDSGADDTLYRTINTESSDALSTQTVIFAGASAQVNSGALSITRARGGNVYCKTMIDAALEGGFFRLPNANVPNGAWDAARTDTEALATGDMWILVPGFAADDQDIMCVFWDASANEISRYIHDDSGNSWAETIFGAPMTFTDVPPSTHFPNFDAAVDLTNSRVFVVAWNAVDTANADLTAWTMTESAITALTDVVTNSTDDQALCAISLDTTTADLTVFYCGKSDGSETVNSSLNIYRKVSKDAGSTWGPETVVSPKTAGRNWLVTCPRKYLGPTPAASNNTGTIPALTVTSDRSLPRASSLIGI
jgi:hypothetical protein